MPPLTHVGRLVRRPPVWAEGRIAIELGRLVRSRVFAGHGVADGAGRPVLLIPGFMAGDSSLVVMRDWLRRSGYHAEMAGIRFNFHYSEALMRQLARRLGLLRAWTGSPIAIVGHSRGGLLGKVLADRHPELVDRVVTLGSPLRDPFDVHPLTMAGVRLAHAYNRVRYARGGAVESGFLTELRAPPAVPVYAVYSRTDGIVHWEACLRADARCIEVRGSHVGLAFNRHVYELIAEILAHRPRPRRRSPAAARAGAGRSAGRQAQRRPGPAAVRGPQ